MLAKVSGLELEWKIAPGLIVSSDPALLRQVLHDLLGNAVRHGTERARVRASRSGARGRVILQISNFVGAAPTAQIGTGIGLRLVRSLSTALGGPHLKIRRTGRVFSARLTFR